MVDKYKTVLLKLSGKAVAGQDGFDFKKISDLTTVLKDLQKSKVKIGIVIGGGNIIRGRSIKNNEIPVQMADYMGMLATNINSLALAGVFAKKKIKYELVSAWPMKGVINSVSRTVINKALKNNKIIIFGGGTGQTGLSTDTAAVMRAKQIKADIILKASDVSAIYDKDPDKFKSAKPLPDISYDYVIMHNIRAMDKQAYILAKKAKLPIRFFKFTTVNLKKIIAGKDIGSLIH